MFNAYGYNSMQTSEKMSIGHAVLKKKRSVDAKYNVFWEISYLHHVLENLNHFLNIALDLL